LQEVYESAEKNLAKEPRLLSQSLVRGDLRLTLQDNDMAPLRQWKADSRSGGFGVQGILAPKDIQEALETINSDRVNNAGLFLDVVNIFRVEAKLMRKCTALLKDAPVR
jgi:hypothetical protein